MEWIIRVIKESIVVFQCLRNAAAIEIESFLAYRKDESPAKSRGHFNGGLSFRTVRMIFVALRLNILGDDGDE